MTRGWAVRAAELGAAAPLHPGVQSRVHFETSLEDQPCPGLLGWVWSLLKHWVLRFRGEQGR